jgi:predicted pyridoxine 5'-phosphate oxidase superfamily flavin-nucleotide-binding protein
MHVAPFHAGEIALQRRAGVHERMAAVGGQVIRDHMPDQHRELFEKLPTLLLATLDDAGQPWPTMLAGAPGFVRTPDARTMRIDAHLAEGDPARAGLRGGASVGVLGLEPHTRRRNRMNGVVSAVEEGGFSVRVAQSFGNCPKYIQGREPEPRADRRPGPVQAEGMRLSDAARGLVARSDTLFIASSSAARIAHAGDRGAGVDVSHRGGPPGFVSIEHGDEGDLLMLPDYVGNHLFNTLGNLMLWPQAGLLWVDWKEGHVLQLAATAQIVHEGAALAAFPGALRLLQLRVLHGWWRPQALPMAWSAAVPAPQFDDARVKFHDGGGPAPAKG